MKELNRKPISAGEVKEILKKLDEDSKHRKTMVSSGDRSAKIRTYNYPQGRVTEHRIGLTKYNLQSTMGGDIQEFIDELQLAENDVLRRIVSS